MEVKNWPSDLKRGDIVVLDYHDPEDSRFDYKGEATFIRPVDCERDIGLRYLKDQGPHFLARLPHDDNPCVFPLECIVGSKPNPLHSQFLSAWHSAQKEVHDTAREKGWWDTDRNNGEMIALMHSELSEALEALRTGNKPDDKVPEFSGVEAELADVVIRIMDAAAGRGWRVGEAIIAKLEYNRSRARKHGKEF